MCLGTLKDGFKAHCRPIIGLDGCHIKSAYPRQFLTAIGMDGSNGWWLVAWIVVEKEAMEQWKWFLTLLQGDLDLPSDGYAFTFISDRQKVIFFFFYSH